MKTFTKFIFVLLVCVILCCVILATQANAALSMLEQVYEKFDSLKWVWMQRMGVLLWWSFSILLALSFSWQITHLAVSGNLSLGSILWTTFQVIIYCGFFKWLFDNPALLNQIPETFIWLAEETTGYSADIFGMLGVGLNIAKNMWEQSAIQLAWYESAFGAICILAVEILFFMIVGQLILTKIETIMITLAGFVLLVFAGFMHSLSDYAKTYLRSLISCGFKMFVIAVVCSMIQEFSGELVTYMGPENGFWTGAGMILGVMVVLWLIVRNIPSFVATSLMGNVLGASFSNAMISHHNAMVGAVKGVAASMKELGLKISDVFKSGNDNNNNNGDGNNSGAGAGNMTMMGIDDGR